jgi:hypothetical protein
LSTRRSPPGGDNRVGSLLGYLNSSVHLLQVYATLSLFCDQWRHLAAHLQDSANVLSSELLVRIHWCVGLRIASQLHSIQFPSILQDAFLSTNARKWSSSKTQSAYLVVWRSPVISSKYLIMDGVS